jgi:predicted nucleic acid-binding protein
MYRIYLDNCCFNRPYDDQTQDSVRFETQAKLFVQGLVAERKVELIWSDVLAYENDSNIFDEKKNAIAQWERLASFCVEMSDEIEELAASIICTGVKEFDALHIACAISAHCSHCITVDKRMLNYRDDRIIICNPIEFLNQYLTKL